MGGGGGREVGGAGGAPHSGGWGKGIPPPPGEPLAFFPRWGRFQNKLFPAPFAGDFPARRNRHNPLSSGGRLYPAGAICDKKPWLRGCVRLFRSASIPIPAA